MTSAIGILPDRSVARRLSLMNSHITLAHSSTQGFIETFARPDHKDEYQPIGRVNLIDDAILCAFVTEVIGPEPLQIMRK